MNEDGRLKKLICRKWRRRCDNMPNGRGQSRGNMKNSAIGDATTCKTAEAGAGEACKIKKSGALKTYKIAKSEHFFIIFAT